MNRKRCHNIDGVLLLDKPVGLTSNDALQRAKRLLGACKAGHAGSLDPIATGLLPLLFGQATRVAGHVSDADKKYLTVFRLGQSTTTFDTEGDVVSERPVTATRAEIEAALAGFRGEIEQLPPMYSAVKHKGQALYRLARAGVEVERTPRHVVIRRFELMALDGVLATFEIECTKGTYVRALAQDLGEVLGCGAHVQALRRLVVGELDVGQAVTLEQLDTETEAERRAHLMPMDAALPMLPAVRLSSLATHYLRQGQPVTARHEAKDGYVRLYDDRGAFLGLGEITEDGQVAPRRLFQPGPATLSGEPATTGD